MYDQFLKNYIDTLIIPGVASERDLLSLRDRLLAAAGPSQNLSDEICEVITRFKRTPVGSMHGPAPHYSGKIDVAIKLFKPQHINDAMNSALKYINRTNRLDLQVWQKSIDDYVWEYARALCIIKIDQILYSRRADMDFMTTEGDRSSVNTPSHEEKAQAKIRAAMTRLNSKNNWTIDDLNQAVDDLMAARIYMQMAK